MIISDIDAFKQAIEPFIETYKIKRNAQPGYTDRGRVSNITIVDAVKAFITPGGKSINTNSDGKGRWVKADYTIYCVSPQYVSMGDLIFTEQYGTLKVHSIDDIRSQGVMSANLVRTSTTQSNAMSNNLLYDD